MGHTTWIDEKLHAAYIAVTKGSIQHPQKPRQKDNQTERENRCSR